MGEELKSPIPPIPFPKIQNTLQSNANSASMLQMMQSQKRGTSSLPIMTNSSRRMALPFNENEESILSDISRRTLPFNENGESILTNIKRRTLPIVPPKMEENVSSNIRHMTSHHTADRVLSSKR